MKLKGKVAKLDPHWAGRRRYLIVLTGFSMAVITLVLWTKLDTAPADTAMMMAFGLLAALAGSYIFGAAWERVSGVPSGNLMVGEETGEIGEVRTTRRREVKEETTVSAAPAPNGEGP